MPDIAALGISVDSREAVAAEANLDKLATTAARTERATDVLRKASMDLVTALRENTSATRTLTSQMAGLQTSASAAGAAITVTATATATATTNVIQFDRAARTARTGLDEMTRSAQQATAAWRALGDQGAITMQRLEMARRMASASAAVGPYQVDMAAGWQGLGRQGSTTLQQLDVTRRMAGTSATTAGFTPAPAGRTITGGGYSGAQQANLGNLLQQGADVAVTGAMGMNPLMIALQQGPQIAQSFMGPGAVRPGEVLSAAADKVGALALRIGLLGGAIAGATTATLAAIVAQQSYSNTQIGVARSVSGAGRASGMTVGNINDLALSGAGGAGVSVRSARELIGQYAATGTIGAGMSGSLLATAKDYAATTGQELATANASLASAFANPTRGAEMLNKQLGFLNDTALENIKRLDAQGNRLGAQRALFDAYKAGLTSATELTTGWSRATGGLTRELSDLWDKFGRVVDRATTGGDLQTRLATAKNALSEAERDDAGSSAIYRATVSGPRVSHFRKEVERLQAEADKATQQSTQAQQSLLSNEVGGIVRSVSPGGDALDQMERRAEKIRSSLSRLPLDEQGAARSALEGMLRTSEQMRQNLAAGGEGLAASVRQAQFGLRTVGFTDQNRGAAQIEFEAAERSRQALSSGSAAQQNAALQAIELERVTRLQTLTAQTQLSLNQGGGAFSRLSPALQSQILGASRGSVSAGIIAGIAGHESSLDPNVGYSRVLGENGRPSSAYGLGQITSGTALEAIRLGYLPQGFDRTNTATMADGIAGVLQMKIDQNGGDLNRGIMAYRGSRDASVNRAYLNDVLRRSGQFGDSSVLGVARDQDTNSQALAAANQNLKATDSFYGRDGAAYDSATRAGRQYQDMLARGVPAAEAAAVAFSNLNTQLSRVERQTKLVQFFRDDEFARDQLGRDRFDQQAYAMARSQFGDTSSPEAQTAIARSRETMQLTEAKGMVSEAMTGFVTELSHGGDALKSFSSIALRIGDRLISSSIDSLVSAGFGGGGGGGFGGLVSSIFGGLGGGDSPTGGVRLFASGGYTGPGGVNQPRGIVHGDEYVMSSADVRRWGGPAGAAAMARGGPGSGQPIQINDNRTIQAIPAQGVTPDELAAVVAQSNRDLVRQIPSIVTEHQRRMAR